MSCTSSQFCITDYGAVGGNVGDQSGAIQSCIDAAETYSLTHGGADVIIPGDLFRVTSGLRISRDRVNLIFTGGAQLVPVGNFDTIHLEHATAGQWMYRNFVVNANIVETGKTGGRTIFGKKITKGAKAFS